MTNNSTKIDNLLKLSEDDIQRLPVVERIEVLERLLKYHNNQYFINNAPVISDELFDRLSESLKKLKPNSPVLFEIVGDIGNVLHPRPMLSIDKRFTYADIRKWIEDTNDEWYLVEPKYDGMAARYQNGVLATRGNGIMGEDISERFQHLRIIGDIKKAEEDSTDGSIYGEVAIPTEYFDENLSKDYKNPRNAVVGIVKAKQTGDAGIKALLEGGVHFILYDQIFAQKVKKEDLLKEDEWKAVLEKTFQSPYPLDGVVLKVINKDLRKNLGATQHHDKWQIAYKVPAEKKWSKVVKIIDSVGRTGRVTSIAKIEPINLSGATVTNVTLHNFEYVKKSKIGIGSKVEVMRSGEVIPFIVQVKPSKNPHRIAEKCPVCDTKLVESGKYLECINPNCPARLSQSIEYFFKVLGVEELGLKTIEKFIDIFSIQNVIGFYDLKEAQIESLEGFGKKSAKNIVGNIQSTLNGKISPNQLVQALGIKEIGPATSLWIINEYGFWNLPKLTIEEISKVKGIGPSKASSFVNDLKEKWWIVEKLKAKGLKFKEERTTSKLEGLSFAITGKKEQYSRDELVERIQQNGGEYKSSVTQDLNYLIAGENAGSKVQKAQEVGAKVISEEDFLKML